MISINYRDPRPVYRQIKDGIRTLILTGALPAEEKLPSVRDLAAELAINPNTIQRAYRELETEGVIYSIPGKGSFASANKNAGATHIAGLKEDFRAEAEKLFQLGISEEELISIIQEVNPS